MFDSLASRVRKGHCRQASGAMTDKNGVPHVVLFQLFRQNSGLGRHGAERICGVYYDYGESRLNKSVPETKIQKRRAENIGNNEDRLSSAPIGTKIPEKTRRKLDKEEQEQEKFLNPS